MEIQTQHFSAQVSNPDSVCFSPSKTQAALPQCRAQAITGPALPRAIFCKGPWAFRLAATLTRFPGMADRNQGGHSLA